MRVKIDYDWGQNVYILNDEEQRAYRINRIILEKGGNICLEVLCPNGELIELGEQHISTERDIVKAVGGNGVESE